MGYFTDKGLYTRTNSKECLHAEQLDTYLG